MELPGRLAAGLAAAALMGAMAAGAAVPGAPSSVVALPGNARATVHFAPPASDGGFPITSYTVTSSPGGFTANATAPPIVVTGLTNGTSYMFTARATNASGTGPLSAASNAIRPIAATIAPAVASTESFSLALDAHGQVYAWGSDAGGQLGQGRPIHQTSPVQVPGLPQMQHIDIFDQALAVDVNGQVWSWGGSLCGGLGERTEPVNSKPARVVGATGVTKVAAGQCRSYALRSNQTVWELTTSGMQQVVFPVGIVDIAAGISHLLALGTDGMVYATGVNSLGELGIGHTNTTSGVVQVSNLTNVTAISASFGASLALLGNGEMRFWGRYSGLQPPLTTPTTVTGLGGPASAISVTSTGMAAIRASDQTVWKWGVSITSATQVTGISSAAKLEHQTNGVNVTFAITSGGALYANGSNNAGQLGQGSTIPVSGSVVVPGFATGASLVRTGFYSAGVLALKTDGTVWFWGANEGGERGDGLAIGSAVPLAVPIPASIKAIAAAQRFGVALDTTGQVWGWGENIDGPLDTNQVDRATAAPVTGASGVAAIAASAYSTVAYAKVDKTAWVSGNVPYLVPGGFALRQVPGLPNIVGVATSSGAVFFVGENGLVYSVGSNLFGEIGDGTTTNRSAPVQVVGIAGTVTKVAAAEFRVCALMSDGRIYTWGSNGQGQSLTGGTNIPVLVPGITDAVDIAVSRDGALARRSGGNVVAWGVQTWLADQPFPTNPTQPFPVTLPQPIQAFALGQNVGLLVGSSGLTWGWGLNRFGSILGTVGDGTYVRRNRPVVDLAHAGGGSIDANNWFLDLQPESAETIAGNAKPPTLATARSFGTTSGLGFVGTVRYKAADLGKRVNNYVLALVPPSFFNQVKTTGALSDPGRLEAKAAKNGGFVLAQLTPAGWEDVGIDLAAYSAGVASAAGGASNILNGIDIGLIPGARFCVGYGETAEGMLATLGLREVLAVEGSSTPTGLPCVLSGIYLGGPSSSVQSTAVSFKVSVVGVTPTGSAQFKDAANGGAYGDLGAPLALVASNPAVSTATYTSSALALGTHSIGATYSGDAVNAPNATLVPKLHAVLAQAQAALEAPASSSLLSEVVLVATVTGNSPTGTVQFFDAGTIPIGAPAFVVEGVAILRTTALGVGSHSITASYSGDGQNSAATSAARPHSVVNVLATVVTLSSNTNPAAFGGSATITVTVAGNTATPTGTVTLRDGATSLGSAPLVNAAAAFTLNSLAAGAHHLSADYTGDNTSATSSLLVQEVSAPPPFLTASVTKTGLGTGSVTSVPFGIDCGAACSEEFLTASNVTLNATPTAGSTFVNWGGDCAGSGSCSLPITATRSVTARFEPAATGLTPAPTTLGFGGQSMNTTSPTQSVIVTNNSGATIAVSSVAVSAGFAATHNCASVANAASCTVSVTFTPPAEGAATANVALFFAQGGTTRVFVIPVAGTGEKSLVTHYYRSILRRDPDAGGKTFWSNEAARVASLGANVNEAWFALAQQFYASPEYAAFNRDNTGFVTDLYTTFFNRAPDSGGLAFWKGQVDAGLPREVALAAFMFSPEFVSFAQAIFGNTAARAEVNTVMDFYRGFLARLPDNGGFAYWVGRFRTAQCQGPAQILAEVDAISSSFAVSAEYGGRARTTSQYVGDLYNAFLRRGGELGGVQHWIDQITTGTRTREGVRVEFRNSAEFQARVQAILQQGCL